MSKKKPEQFTIKRGETIEQAIDRASNDESKRTYEHMKELSTMSGLEFIKPSRNPAFNKVIQDLINMHDKKNHDYANDENPFSNFDFAADYLNSFGQAANATISLQVLKGTKLARIFNVINKAGVVNNESLEDSEFDFVVYWILERANRLYR